MEGRKGVLLCPYRIEIDHDKLWYNFMYVYIYIVIWSIMIIVMLMTLQY